MLKVESQTKFVYAFQKLMSKVLTSGVFYKFKCELYHESYYRRWTRNFAEKRGKYIGISVLNNKSVPLKKKIGVCHQLLNCDYFPHF